MNKDISITYCKINDLRPFAGNPRKISDEEMAKLRRSVREFGVVDPVVAQQGTNMVIGGHQRLEAAKAEGVKTVPVVYLDIDDSRAHLLNVALNKISGEWDWSKLGDLFQELDSGDIDLELSGFDMGEIEGLMNGLDESPLKLDLSLAPETVQKNIEKLKEIKELRRQGNESVIGKTDTERFMIIVFTTRKDREKAMQKLGLPTDEKYVASSCVEIKALPWMRHTLQEKVSDAKRTGATG